MNFHDKLYRAGGIFVRKQRSLPVLFAIATPLALLVAPPFQLYCGVVTVVLSALATLCGIAIRYMSLRKDPTDMEARTREMGIYSLIRFPQHLSSALIMFGLTLYCGVGWYTLIYIGVAALVLERMMLFEDGVGVKRYGDEYSQWCERTNALFIPVRKFLPFMHGEISTIALRREAILLLSVASAYLLINLMKNLLIEFSFTIDLICAIIMGISLLSVGLFSLFPVVLGHKGQK